MFNFLSIPFWFSSNSSSIGLISRSIVIAFLVFLLGLIIYTVMTRPRKNNAYAMFWAKTFSFALINLIVGSIIVFLNYETIPVLSIRLWFLIWGAEMIYWGMLLFKFYEKTTKKVEASKKNKEHKKYIPK